MAGLSFGWALGLLIWSLLWSPSLQDSTYSFTNPPPDSSKITNPSYTVGTDIDIEWVGGNDFVSVRLVHVLPSEDFDEFIYVFRNVTNLGGHYTWPIDLGGMNLTSSHEFFFNIFVEGETSPRAITHDFNLTQAVTSTTAPASTSFTTSASTSSSTTSSTITTQSSATNPATSAASPTNTNVPESSGLSTGAKAGIGVGVAVGVIAILAAVAFWWRSRHGKSGAGGAAAGSAESGQATGTPYQPVNQQPPYEYYKDSGAPTEVPAQGPVSELSGSQPMALEMADTSQHHR